MTPDEEQALRHDIEHLRKMNTKDSCEAADRLEARLIVLKRQTDRIEQLTVDKLKEWVAEIYKAIEGKHRVDDVRSWPKHLRDEIFQALQLAWAASRFRVRETADLLEVKPSVVHEWLNSEDFNAWSLNAGPRSMRVVAMADLAISRMGHILSIETNDVTMLNLQLKAASNVMTAGITVPQRQPRVPGEKDKKRALPAGDGERVPTRERRTKAVK